MKYHVWLVLVLCLFLPPRTEAAEPKPVVEGDQGRKAFNDLAAYYADNTKIPPFAAAITDLKSDDEKKRVAAGDYLFALFKQSFADEDNGRSVWRKTPYFGGGTVNDAREFRKQLGVAFGEKAAGDGAVAATRWLLDEERLPDNQKAGALALARLEGPKSVELLKALVAPPHSNVEVVTLALAEVGRRKLKDLGPNVLPLCAHYREAVRDAARKVAKDLDLTPVPEYFAEKAFTPRLEKQLKEVAALVFPEIPDKAKWVEVAGEGKDAEKVTGWLVSEKGDDYRLVDWFGDEVTLPKKAHTLKAITLADTAKVFADIRSDRENGRERVGQLSRRGMLTMQFQPRFVSQPELIVGAWAFVRGERKTAADILFSRIDQMRDDRWLTDIARDLIGHGYHQQMLEDFCFRRDYERTLALAKHLSKPVFEDYQYQSRAKRLVAQLPLRGDDFKKLNLPTPEEWKAQKAKMSREEQIKFLVARLRLLNCRQQGQPGGVDYDDDQSSASFAEGDKKGKKVINPYVELQEMKLQVSDVPLLIPSLADENYLLVFSYWRDFHPGRTLHQVNWLVTGLINNAAARDLADLGTFNGLDEEGRKKHLEKILAWCKTHANMTRVELLLDGAATAEDYREFHAAAAELLRTKEAKVLPVLVARTKDFPKMRGEIVEMCRKLDSAEAVEPARGWVKSDDPATKFWAALILLRHGDKAKAEGLEPLKAVLADDDGTHYFPRALDDLLAVKSEATADLACEILKKPHFAGERFNVGPILHRLVLAGRKEALDYVLAQLDNTEEAGTVSGEYKGKKVQRMKTQGDHMADNVAEWRTDKWGYESLAPDEDRKKQREDMKGWLKEQFAKVKKGEKSELRTDVRPLQFPQWQIDAP
jgi:hypothetical protein